jgi:hypothetical protein
MLFVVSELALKKVAAEQSSAKIKQSLRFAATNRISKASFLPAVAQESNSSSGRCYY